MKKVFIDTGAIVAKELARDQFHGTAVEAWGELANGRVALYSSEHVLDESATLIGRRSTGEFAAGWGEDLLELADVHWLSASQDELRKAMEMMRQYSDQGVSFTDSVSFVLMKRERIRHVFGYDRHFQLAGFRLWPE